MKSHLLMFVMSAVLGSNVWAQTTDSSAAPWVSLFNGKDLTGWTPKFSGHALGKNYRNTFRVEDGMLKVCYDEYETFGPFFGHLFYETPYSHYRLRIEYRFVGEQVAEGPGWAYRNSGIMLHCQDPKTMRIDQEFPVSIEAQMLGGNGKDERPTANVCTPGTHFMQNGKLITKHCTTSSSKTFHGDQWVTMELEVHGSDKIQHWVNGEMVFAYEKPQFDENDQDAKKLIKNGQVLLSEGHFSLQAESHPLECRKIEIQLLEK